MKLVPLLNAIVYIWHANIINIKYSITNAGVRHFFGPSFADGKVRSALTM